MNKFLILGLVLTAALAVEQINHANEGPAKIILDYLDDIVENVENEQLEHDKLNREQMAECDEEKKFRAQEIIDGQDALSRSTAHKLRCEGSEAEAKADLSTVKQYQQEVKATLAELKARRTEQRQAFESLIKNEIDPAIEAVKGAFPIIDKFANSGAAGFVELSRHMMYSFTKVSRAGHGGLMAASLTALAQAGMEQAFDAQTIQKIRSLFEVLLADLKEAKNKAIALEKQRIQVYTDTTAEYNAILDKLDKQEIQLTQYVKDMGACVAQETNIIAAATEKVKNNTAALEYAIRMCDAFTKEYEEATKARDAEIALLQKLKEFIKKEAEIFGAYGVNNSDVFNSYQKESGSKVDADAIDKAIKAAQNQKVQAYLIQVRNMGQNRQEKKLEKVSFLDITTAEQYKVVEAPKVSFVQGKLMRATY